MIYLVQLALVEIKILLKNYFCNLYWLLKWQCNISVFDDDGNGVVDYKELLMGIEIFKDNSIEDKIKSSFKNSFIFIT